jgi:hypothetical protein
MISKANLEPSLTEITVSCIFQMNYLKRITVYYGRSYIMLAFSFELQSNVTRNTVAEAGTNLVIIVSVLNEG